MYCGTSDEEQLADIFTNARCLLFNKNLLPDGRLLVLAKGWGRFKQLQIQKSPRAAAQQIVTLYFHIFFLPFSYSCPLPFLLILPLLLLLPLPCVTPSDLLL
jgi:hypothetical protein